MKLTTLTRAARLALALTAAISACAVHAQASAPIAVSDSAVDTTKTANAEKQLQHLPVATPTRNKKMALSRRIAKSCAPHGPTLAIGDPSLVSYDYDPDCTFLVRLRTDQETHIVFAPDEEVVGVYLSNTGKRWLYHTAITKRDLFIEARLGALSNAATIITSRRRYELELRSSDSGAFNHRVSWDYGDNDASSATKDSPFGTEYGKNVPSVPNRDGDSGSGPRIDLTHANFNYKIEGDAPFTPTLVVDNGRFTYLQLPHNARLPAIMVLDGHGDGEITDLISLGNDIYEVPEITEYGLLLERDKVKVRIYNQNPDRCGSHGCGHSSEAYRPPTGDSRNASLYGKS
jgi:type IV secretion system protein VirB9